MWCGIEVRWPSSSGKGWPYHPSQRVSHLNPYRNHISLIFKLVGVWCNHYYLIILLLLLFSEGRKKRRTKEEEEEEERKKYIIIIITPTTPHPNK
jgi:hypothetical protein